MTSTKLVAKWIADTLNPYRRPVEIPDVYLDEIIRRGTQSGTSVAPDSTTRES